MLRRGRWGYGVVALLTLASCGALLACSVETTTIERHADPTDPTTPPTAEPEAPDPDSMNGSSPGTSGSGGASGSHGGTSGGTGTSGGSAGTSGGGKDGGADSSSGNTSSGGTSSGGTSGGTSGPFDQFQQRNLQVINQYRATKGLAPIALDKQLSTFALAGSQQLSQDHTPHQHFITASNNGTLWNNGFTNGAAENQGDPHGWNKMSNDPVTNELMQIDDIQLAMFNEGPGAGTAHGHYMNMMNPAMKRVGVGLLMVGTSLYLTNDFSQ